MNAATVSFANLSRETLLAICDQLGGDGHGLYDPQFLIEAGVPREYVDAVTHTHKSDGSNKGTIFNEGQPVPEMTAVYSLSLYRRIGRDLGLSESRYEGRGFQARDWDERIREYLA